jgi:uncharacterized Zn finger protein (UPF0148 family)
LFETWCPECGFRLDAINESQVVCPACGTDPRNGLLPESDPETAAAVDDAEVFAEASISLAEVLEGDARLEPEVDHYDSDPDLELMIADAEALRAALVEVPILVAGNKLIN